MNSKRNCVKKVFSLGLKENVNDNRRCLLKHLSVDLGGIFERDIQTLNQVCVIINKESLYENHKPRPAYTSVQRELP